MEYKNSRVFIIAFLVFTILSAGCSIAVTKNVYNVKPKELTETDSTAYSLQLGSKPPTWSDEAR